MHYNIKNESLLFDKVSKYNLPFLFIVKTKKFSFFCFRNFYKITNVLKLN
jgi:hypothetical protein